MKILDEKGTQQIAKTIKSTYNAIQGDISDETTARKNGDTNLQGQIDDLKADRIIAADRLKYWRWNNGYTIKIDQPNGNNNQKIMLAITTASDNTCEVDAIISISNGIPKIITSSVACNQVAFYYKYNSSGQICMKFVPYSGSNIYGSVYASNANATSLYYSVLCGPIDGYKINKGFDIEKIDDDSSATWTEVIRTGDGCVSILHDDLVTMASRNQLIPGLQYRITDYVCLTNEKDDEISSASHEFDIIVTADSTNKLNEVARAIRSDYDEEFPDAVTDSNGNTTAYFANSKLEAWKIWYCIDNDTDRFPWARVGNDIIGTGRGVIYRMIDEYGNDCNYDFKNIMFKRYRASIEDSNMPNGWLRIGNNDADGQYVGADGTLDQITSTFEIKVTNKDDYKYVYTFSTIPTDNQQVQDASVIQGTNVYCWDNKITGNADDYGILGKHVFYCDSQYHTYNNHIIYGSKNTFGPGFNCNTNFAGSFYVTGNAVNNLNVGVGSYFYWIGNNTSNCSIGNCSTSSVIGPNCAYITIDNGCSQIHLCGMHVTVKGKNGIFTNGKYIYNCIAINNLYINESQTSPALSVSDTATDALIVKGGNGDTNVIPIYKLTNINNNE